MTVNEFEQQLGGFGESLQDITAILLQVAGPIVDDIKRNAPVGETGYLKQSIQARVQNDSLFIEMLYYGMFQNFGVNGTQTNIADDVPEGISNRPLFGTKYAFKKETINGIVNQGGANLPFAVRKSIATYGLQPKRFFDVDLITEIVADGVAQQLTQEF